MSAPRDSTLKSLHSSGDCRNGSECRTDSVLGVKWVSTHPGRDVSEPEPSVDDPSELACKSVDPVDSDDECEPSDDDSSDESLGCAQS